MTTTPTTMPAHTAKDGKGILITEPAMQQLAKLCGEQGTNQVLRVGVRSGGCSGMSYTMDFVPASDTLGRRRELRLRIIRRPRFPCDL
jgi:Fe-S cluster assembly iron-binding protein IscA